MRSRYSICLSVALCLCASAAGHAQTPAPPDSSANPPASKSAEAQPAQPAQQPGASTVNGSSAGAATSPTSATPSAAASAPGESAAPVAPGTATGSADLSVPSPAEMEHMLSEQLANAPVARDATAPAQVVTLHGYMRVRGELYDHLWLGRPSLAEYKVGAMSGDAAKQGPDPFTRFRPLENQFAPPDGCPGEGRTASGTCDVGSLRFANMRLRLSPEIALSEDVRIKMQFDVFDNVILGEPPVSYYGQGGAGMNTVFANGVQPPPSGGRLGDAIKPRRAWAEVRNRNLGELRFGRMPRSWGLGMYYNAGDGLDDDYSTDLDGVTGITKLAGIYLSAGYDFLGEGFFQRDDERPLEQSQLDDVDQFTFSAAVRSTPEELAAAREQGGLLLNGGVQFSLRHQDSLYDENAAKTGTSMTDASTAATRAPLRTIDATHYTTDVWGMMRYKGLRLEAEAVWVTGRMDHLALANGILQPPSGRYNINQLGYVLQAEYRLVEDHLGLYFEHGLATGDNSVDGLNGDPQQAGSGVDLITQQDRNNTVSTFRFHPAYRVDLILWRNLMRQVTGAYYFRPSLSYDFVKSSFGQLAGARLDVIWSRASAVLQTWGNKPDLGVEIDASLYFRSEDGPELTDGFHAVLQYGVLFPMQGLNYLQIRSTDPKPGDLHVAQTLRLVLGVAF